MDANMSDSSDASREPEEWLGEGEEDPVVATYDFYSSSSALGTQTQVGYELVTSIILENAMYISQQKTQYSSYIDSQHHLA